MLMPEKTHQAQAIATCYFSSGQCELIWLLILCGVLVNMCTVVYAYFGILHVRTCSILRPYGWVAHVCRINAHYSSACEHDVLELFR